MAATTYDAPGSESRWSLTELSERLSVMEDYPSRSGDSTSIRIRR